MRRGPSGICRVYLARDVVECPECGEPDPFLGLFLRQGRGATVRLWRLVWVTSAPTAFARWVGGFCPEWRRASEFFVNHCGSCGAPLADPLGFQRGRGWLCDAGIDVAVTAGPTMLSVEGFSPGAVVSSTGYELWEDALRLTPREFRRRFRDAPRFIGEGVGGMRVAVIAAPAPHRWRLLEKAPRGRRPVVDEAFFVFTRAKDAARARFNVKEILPDH
jgi:hypothetical protein